MPLTFGPVPAPAPLEREGVAREPALRPRPGTVSHRPHVCFVAPTTWPLLAGSLDIPVVGGAEVQQSLVAPALAARGWRVSMITLDFGQQDRTVVKGVTVHKLYKPDAGIPVVRFIHPRLTTLWRVLGRVGADVYYQRTAAALTGFLAAYCRRHGKRSVYSGASDVDFIPGRQDVRLARDRWLFEHGLRNVDRVFVQNANQARDVRLNYGRESSLVPNCFEAPPGSRADREGYVLWVATVRAQKRPELLLDIARRLPHRRFVMVGGADIGPRGEEYAAGVREAAGALPNVEYRGFLPFAEADRLFDGARLVVNTSVYEGFPNTFMQAWSRGVPAVAFVDTGSRQDGEPVYDIVSEVGDASARIERLMGDDAAWEAASARVSTHFRENHSLQAVVGAYEREFEALWQAAPGGGQAQ